MPLSRLTHTFPLDFAEAISGLEAVPPASAVEGAFWVGALAEEPAAGFAGAEFAVGAELAAGAELATGAEAEAAEAAEADFLLLEADVSDIADELAGAVECVVLSLAAAFLLL
jgi:hypothetical protein